MIPGKMQTCAGRSFSFLLMALAIAAFTRKETQLDPGWKFNLCEVASHKNETTRRLLAAHRRRPCPQTAMARGQSPAARCSSA
jgi:hypothetical protein